MAILEVKNLKVYFKTEEGIAKAVDDVSFSVNEGEVLGIVGESGSGKSVTSLAVMRLLPGNAQIEGEILFKGKNLLGLPDDQMRQIRGADISMIFQEPMTALNPVFTIGYQIMEAILLHQDVTEEEAKERAVAMLERVGIPAARDRLWAYPHEFSGGMRQRVMIAMALVCNPSLLIADEPTTALDVTIQAQILDLMNELRKEFKSSIILITHDMGVVAETSDRVIVMYAGKIMEEADVFELFKNPLHPYTRGLLASIPRLDVKTDERLKTIPGVVPSAYEMPKGCRFCTRCSEVMDICHEKTPPVVEVAKGHKVACWKFAK